MFQENTFLHQDPKPDISPYSQLDTSLDYLAARNQGSEFWHLYPQQYLNGIVSTL